MDDGWQHCNCSVRQDFLRGISQQRGLRVMLRSKHEISRVRSKVPHMWGTISCYNWLTASVWRTWIQHCRHAMATFALVDTARGTIAGRLHPASHGTAKDFATHAAQKVLGSATPIHTCTARGMPTVRKDRFPDMHLSSIVSSIVNAPTVLTCSDQTSVTA